MLPLLLYPEDLFLIDLEAFEAISPTLQAASIVIWRIRRLVLVKHVRQGNPTRVWGTRGLSSLQENRILTWIPERLRIGREA